MARYAGVTQWQVRQVWQAADVKPHRLKTFKLSKDPRFAEKVIDVVGLYLNPPDNGLVLSVDEKTQIQALDRTHPLLPAHSDEIDHQFRSKPITRSDGNRSPVGAKRRGTWNHESRFSVLVAGRGYCMDSPFMSSLVGRVNGH